MPTEHTTYSYTYDELSDDAKQRAIETLSTKMMGDWFEAEPIAEVIVYALAEEFESPEWDTKGVGDFPGIDRVELIEWDLDHGTIGVKGVLTRENAPKLPWHDSLDVVYLRNADYWKHIAVELADDEYWDEDERMFAEKMASDMEQAVQDALSVAIHSGQREHEYLCSEENMVEMAECYRFDEDGDLF